MYSEKSSSFPFADLTDLHLKWLIALAGNYCTGRYKNCAQSLPMILLVLILVNSVVSFLETYQVYCF